MDPASRTSRGRPCSVTPTRCSGRPTASLVTEGAQCANKVCTGNHNRRLLDEKNCHRKRDISIAGGCELDLGAIGRRARVDNGARGEIAGGAEHRLILSRRHNPWAESRADVAGVERYAGHVTRASSAEVRDLWRSEDRSSLGKIYLPEKSCGRSNRKTKGGDPARRGRYLRCGDSTGTTSH